MVISGGPDIIEDGLVLHLDVADKNSYAGGGTVWTDLSGNGNNGTLTNGPTFSSANAGTLVFDGSNDRIQCSNSTSLNIVNSITMESWINPTAYKIGGGSGGMIITKLSYYMELNSTGKIRLYFYDLSSPGYHVGNITIPLNKWSHVVGVRDHLNNSIKIFVNRELDLNLTNITGNIRSNSTPVTLGSYSGSGYEYTGNIAIGKIYNRALSANEVQQNYNATKGRYGL